jgi:hypothetical protein
MNMQPSRNRMTPGHHALAILVFLLPAANASAQGVFKCVEAGKTVYQAAPCAGHGKAIEIAPGPTEQQVQDAKARADADKARSGAYVPVSPPRQQLTHKAHAPRKIDCAQLDQQRATAYGRRNAALRSSRFSNMDHSAAVDEDNNLIRSIEAEMMAGGCKPG